MDPLTETDGDSLDFALREEFARVERAKQEWESAVDALPELICVVDAGGRVVRGNRTVERWRLGSVRAVQGRRFHGLIHPDCTSSCELALVLDEVLSAAARGGPTEKELFDDNLGRFIRLRVRPVDATGWIEGNSNLVVILQDISAAKRMESALQRHTRRLESVNAISQAILTAQSAPDVAAAALRELGTLLDVAQAHIFVYADKANRITLLASYGDVASHFRPGLTLTLDAFAPHPRRRLRAQRVLPDLASAGAPSPMERYWLDEGIKAMVQMPLTAETATIGALFLLSPRSEILEPQAISIAREGAELITIAIHQSRLYERLRRANEELRTSVRARHEMLQNMGHEVRAPLGLFRGYTDLLAKESLGPLTDEQRDAIKVLGEKGEQLMSIVDRLLTLQTIDKDRLQKTTVDVAALIHQVAFEWRVVAEKKKMTIGVSVAPDLPVIQADRPLLIQVLGNLLDNAVKYSLERDEIRIGAGFDAGYVIIAVRDTGQGISPNALTQVFERFFREGDVRAEIKGVGIGLALCKAVVEAHDGRIWAESPGKGKGTTFFVALPA